MTTEIRSLIREIFVSVPEGLIAPRAKLPTYSPRKPKETKSEIADKPPTVPEDKEEKPTHVDKKTGSVYRDGSTFGPETAD